MTYGEEAQIFPVAQIYDTGVMRDYIAAARAEYERGLADYEKFMSKYGDFASRSPYDVQQWNKYTVDGISDILNKAQAAGVDMRSPELRAELRKFERSLPKTELAALKQNAADYDAWTAAQQRLIQEGKYDPEYAKMEGLGPSEFRTINPETGEISMFGRTSPTPILDMTNFTRDAFKDLKPNLYEINEGGVRTMVKAITADDIRKTAEGAYESLSQTPQGQLMLKRYMDVEGLSEEEARERFIDDVAASQIGKIHSESVRDDSDLTKHRFNIDLENIRTENDKILDDYRTNNDIRLDNAKAVNDQTTYRVKKETDYQYDNYSRYDIDNNRELSPEELELREQDMKAAIEKTVADAEKAKNGGANRGDLGQEGTQETGFSLAQRWYDAGLAKFLSSDGITKNWWDMAGSYEDNASLIYDKAMKFGEKFGGKEPSANDLIKYYTDDRTKHAVLKAINTPENKRTNHQKELVNGLKDKYYADNNVKKHYQTSEIIDAFKNQYTIKMDTKSVATAIGDTISGNDRVVQPTAATMDNLYGINDIVTNTTGYRRSHINDTELLKAKLNQYKPSELTITPMGDGYASLRKTGEFMVMPRVRITFPDGTTEDAYYDIGLSGMKNQGGAYMQSNRKQVLKQGSKPKLYSTPNQIANLDVDLSPNIEYYDGNYSLYPDYNNWTQFGPWDIRTSSELKASPSQKLGGY